MNLSILLAVTFISGVNPELHTFNHEGECGTGAVVPWAGSLWAISYAPHMPNCSSDKLYEIKPDMTRVIRAESIGFQHPATLQLVVIVLRTEPMVREVVILR